MKNTAVNGSTKDIVLVGEARVLNEKTNTLERVHLLLDTDADRSFISKDLADKLQLKDLHTLTLKISTFGSQTTMEKKCGVTTLQIYDCMGRAHQFSVAQIEHLTEEIHRSKLSEEDKRYLIDNDIELSVKPSIETVQPQDNREILKQYHETFLDQIQKGIIEEIDPNLPREGDIIHYLSHQAVITPDKEYAKLRVVFDASAHFKDQPSLNDVLYLYQGPVILPMMCDMLLRFRVGDIAIIACVEKAFLQVRLHPADRDATCCLWVRDVAKPPKGDNLVQYRFTRVTFGLNCSPFLLAGTIQHHLKTTTHHAEVAHELASNVYVDNVILSASDEEHAILKYEASKALFGEMKMNLRGFQTNNTHVNDAIPQQDRSAQKVTKVLGILWDSNEDTIRIQHILAHKTATLKSTARLVLLADASSQAMACCAHIVEGAESHLLFAKSRLPNAKQNPTIPKVEINSITMAVRMAHMIYTALKDRVHFSSVVIFTDSEIALSWLAKYPLPKDVGVLVRNRVQEIRRIVADIDKPVRFGHMSTGDNPADYATRGLRANELRDHIWRRGPEFLRSVQATRPKENQQFSLPPDDNTEVEPMTMETQGLFRCCGRMDNAQIPELTRKSLFISAKTPLAACIIQEAHLPLHRGTSHTIATDRERFWIPHLRQQVQATLRKCIACQRFNRLPLSYPAIGLLPPKRVMKAKPFEHSGIDYSGPLTTKRGQECQKAYGIILTCMTTRLLHIEVVHEMSTEMLLMALRRFFVRRGVPATITSDNGPSFLLAHQILEQAVLSITIDKDLRGTMARRGIEWTTITPYAPWRGRSMQE
ncbi:hypothetical protein ANCDUO_15286 [Ancylostoma duodenale]|uniref:Integrase catalytic domain-containing protein n=1 Tax=Ancylostoma duodenale TaxID=51022 RepID=A0A0C2GC61_9BILA|nr:hypothetical protein ANCDUO_15286 [Ancylostoma duodenale]